MFQRQWRQAQKPRSHVATKSKGGVKKTVARKKPDWDIREINTVNDLTVHQLSKEELELRRSRILSKNADRAKRELEEIAKGARQLSSAGSHRSSDMGKTTGEKDKERLHNILEESDQALSVVKDLFGDDPKRYTGQPNITVAPHVTMDKAALQRTLLESRLGGPTPSALNSPGGIRDESVLGLAPAKPALNDLPSPSSDFTIDESNFEMSSLQLSPPTSSYQPVVVDLPRFQRLVEEHEETGEREGSRVGERGGGEVGGKGGRVEAEELSSIAHTGSQQGGGNVTVDSNLDSAEGGVSNPASCQPQNTIIPPQGQHHPLQIVHKMPTTCPTTSVATSGPNTALAGPPGPLQQSSHSISTSSISRNQRLRKLPPGRAASVGGASNGIHDDLSVLQKLVQDLERELQEYEETSGYCFPVKKPGITQSGTFTSLTASLLASVTKLTHYLKQSEIQLKGEVAVRNQLLHAMAEQQNLMDALTADVVKLQEENSSLKSGFQQLEHTTTQQTKTLQEDVLELHTKIRALEQIKPLPVGATSSELIGSCSKPPASVMTSPPVTHSKPSPLLKTEDPVGNCEPSATKALSPSPPSPQVHPSSPNESMPTITNTQGSTLNAGLTPTPIVPSTKPFLPPSAMYYHPWSLINMESTPALYHTPGTAQHRLTNPSIHFPFTPTPLPVTSALPVPGVTPELSISMLSPSSVSIPPLPHSLPPSISLPASNVSASALSTSIAPHVPPILLHPTASTVPVSLDSEVSKPTSNVCISALPLSLCSQAPPISLPSYTLPFQPIPPTKSLPFSQPPSNLPVSVQQHQPPSTQSLLPPLSLPYSWEAPVAASPTPVSRGNTVALPSATTATQVHPSSSATVTPKKLGTTVPLSQKRTLAPPMTLPDLSLSVSSLPAPEVKSRSPEVSPSQSDSSLDIEASLARMSSLARSVLQELAQDRGHLLSSVSQPPPHSYSTGLPLPQLPHSVPAVDSLGSMTTVTSLDSELTPSVDSTATQDSPLPNDLSPVSSSGKDSPTSVSTQ